MGRKVIQAPQEIICFKADIFTVLLNIVSNTEAETVIDITGATNITLKAYEFLDSTSPSIDIIGSVADGPNGIIQFDFVASDTENLAAQTYIYVTNLTLNGSIISPNKNQLTVRETLV